MTAFLGAKLLGLPRYLWIGLVLVAIVWWVTSTEKADDRNNQEIGAAKAVVSGQETTLKQIGAANEAGNDVRSSTSNARYDECMRGAAEGYASFCERYRTVEPVPGR